MKFRFMVLLAAVVGHLLYSAPAAAETEPPILTVSGRIGKTNTPDNKSFAFTFAELQKLGDAQITSTTRYVAETTTKLVWALTGLVVK